jgi:hypothetical protein
VAARIRSVLRRRDSRREGPRRIGDLFIDPARREIRVGDREVKLANKEFACVGTALGLFKPIRRAGGNGVATLASLLTGSRWSQLRWWAARNHGQAP